MRRSRFDQNIAILAFRSKRKAVKSASNTESSEGAGGPSDSNSSDGGPATPSWQKEMGMISSDDDEAAARSRPGATKTKAKSRGSRKNLMTNGDY